MIPGLFWGLRGSNGERCNGGESKTAERALRWAFFAGQFHATEAGFERFDREGKQLLMTAAHGAVEPGVEGFRRKVEEARDLGLGKPGTIDKQLDSCGDLLHGREYT